jgi:hypothetical protein
MMDVDEKGMDTQEHEEMVCRCISYLSSFRYIIPSVYFVVWFNILKCGKEELKDIFAIVISYTERTRHHWIFELYL